MSASLVTDPSVNPLKVGSSAKYVSAGTTGNIVKIITDDDGTFRFVDKTRLYYITDILTVVKKSEEKYSEENTYTVEEVKGALEKQNEFFPSEIDHSSLEFDG